VDDRYVAGRFPTTRYSAVLEVGSDDPVTRVRSFERLARAYWKPVYKTIRVRWNKPDDQAQDLCQGFFATAFEKEWFKSYDAGKARFRTFVRTCLDRFLAKERRDAGRLKRGGDALVLSFDFADAEAELSRELGGAADADYFDREWVSHLFALSVQALQESCQARGKGLYYRVFERYDLGEPDERPSYAVLAAELGIKTTDVTNYLAAARRELRGIILDTLRELTASEEEFREEARALLGVDP
jgi:DNA-directed RNA polymerase specialized sigma24 family protein